jgi:hypothetical protein
MTLSKIEPERLFGRFCESRKGDLLHCSIAAFVLDYASVVIVD